MNARAGPVVPAERETKAPPLRAGLPDKVEREDDLEAQSNVEALTLPSDFPALGHDLDKVVGAHSKDLSAQEVCPLVPYIRYTRGGHRERQRTMDIGIVTAIVMLVTWAAWTFGAGAPGYAHLLLTGGVALLIWRVVTRGSAKP